MKAPWTTLQDLAGKLVADQEPQQRPVAIAFFSQAALMAFLATLESEPEGDEIVDEAEPPAFAPGQH